MFHGEIFWLAAIVIFCIIEGLTFSLVCIWFAGGAVAALFLSLFGLGPLFQYSAFVIVSALLLYFTRPILKRYFTSKKSATNADRVIGKPALVTVRIDPAAGAGQVKVLGQIWSARPVDGISTFEEGDAVSVTDIAGVKVLVEAIGATESAPDGD